MSLSVIYRSNPVNLSSPVTTARPFLNKCLLLLLSFFLFMLPSFILTFLITFFAFCSYLLSTFTNPFSSLLFSFLPPFLAFLLLFFFSVLSAIVPPFSPPFFLPFHGKCFSFPPFLPSVFSSYPCLSLLPFVLRSSLPALVLYLSFFVAFSHLSFNLLLS